MIAGSQAVIDQVSEGDMTTIRIVLESMLPADDVLAAAHDFTARRSRIFKAVQPKYLVVHEIGDGFADVTEGTRAGPIVNWERCHYDWSTPGHVIATVIDSNVYAFPGSRWELSANASGTGSTVEMIWTRRFNRRPKGRLFGFAFLRIGRSAFGKYAAEIIESLEKTGTGS